MTVPAEDLRHVELLTMTAYYHHTDGLGLGHTFPIGEPWLSGSACDHMLVSLPYPFGPGLEVCCLGEQNLRLSWLLPITKAEREFKAEHGRRLWRNGSMLKRSSSGSRSGHRSSDFTRGARKLWDGGEA